jgi:hypothetical protein
MDFFWMDGLLRQYNNGLTITIGFSNLLILLDTLNNSTFYTSITLSFLH